MAALKSRFKREDFRKYREPGIYFGGGLLAGLLLFLTWLALQPDKAFLASQPAAGGAAQGPPGAGQGGRNGVTGLEPGQRSQSMVIGPGEPEAAMDQAGLDEGGEPPGSEPGAAGDADAPEMTDEQAIADGLLDAPAPPFEDAAPGAELQAYYVEVRRGPGVSEILEVNAESAEHARSIIRDFRGDPRIIRGPSLRPLD